MSDHIWLYNGHAVAPRDTRLPDQTPDEKRDSALNVEMKRRENVTDPTDPIALARRLWDQIATRHMEAHDADQI